MPAERLPMRRIKEIIRLSWACGLSARQVSWSLKVARSTVGGVFEESQGSWAELASA